MPDAEFDQYACSYQGLVDASISISGETAAHFAEQRIRYLQTLLARRGHAATNVLDYGCGIGLATPLLTGLLGANWVCGVDVSAESIAVAQSKPLARTSFLTVNNYRPAANFDVCYSSGVFHHIMPADRPTALTIVRDALRPGGLMALWEQNPFNPGTRWAMYNCVFDADAQTLSARTGRRLLHDSGFDIIATRYLFVFPRSLKFLRFIEPKVAMLPIGAQYLILAKKR